MYYLLIAYSYLDLSKNSPFNKKKKSFFSIFYILFVIVFSKYLDRYDLFKEQTYQQSSIQKYHAYAKASASEVCKVRAQKMFPDYADPKENMVKKKI